MDLITDYNILLEKYDNFFTSPIDTNLDLDTIDIISKNYLQLSKLDYLTKQKKVEKFKSDYLTSNTIDNDKKISAILQWNLTSKSNTDFPIDNKILIEFINKLNTQYFNTIFELIKLDKITFNYDEIKSLPIEFFKYIGSNLLHIIETSDDFESNISMSSLEIFFVNVLMILDTSDLTNYKLVTKMLKGLGWMTHKSLNFFPSGKVKKFSGDLIQQISSYYSENLHFPLINNRINVGIVINNSTNQYYNFNEFFQFNDSIFCNEISIEFPYMSWIYPEYVEIEYKNSSSLDVKILPGFEYMLRPFRNITNNTKTVDIVSKQTSSKTVQLYQQDPYTYIQNPCIYLKLHIKDYAHISNIKVYGRAISLI